MTIKYETTLKDFRCWGNAIETIRKLTDEELSTLDDILDEDCMQGYTENELNDFLSFDTETICEWLGISEEEWDAR